MTAAAGDRPAPARRGRVRELAIALLAAMLVSLLTRAWTFGNPVVHVDEQFYLAVGDRLLRGALPYVDIWDIKPIGLFALYAAIAWAFPDSIVAYQLVALVAVVATALLLFVMARRVASLPAALLCCGAYPAWLTVFDGIGGQSEVFLNLPVAGAAAICVARFTGPGRSRACLGPGVAAMLLIGIALQIKYSAVFQGVFFGLFMLVAIPDARRRPGHVAACLCAWIATALAPTLLGLALYAADGHGGAFFYANFVSIFHRQSGVDTWWALLWKQLAILTPFWMAATVAVRRLGRLTDIRRDRARFVLLWSAASVAGYLLFGGYHHSYVLPLLPPLCVTAAMAVGQVAGPGPRRALAAGLALTVMGAGAGLLRVTGKGVSPANRSQIAAVTRAVNAHLDGGCLYVVDGPPILYYLTHACTVTRFLFPSHLGSATNAPELGIDDVGTELRRTFARRPRVVVTRSSTSQSGDRALDDLVSGELARAYARVPGLDSTGLAVFVRRDGAARCRSISAPAAARPGSSARPAPATAAGAAATIPPAPRPSRPAAGRRSASA